jgi:hypothetical protein
MAGTIEIRIKKGQIHMDVEGVHDATCADITKVLEQALGVVEDVQRKPEYYVELDNLEQKIYEE